MQIVQERQERAITLKLHGRLETRTAPELQEVVENELEDVMELGLDLEDLEYVSSAGLRVLLAASKRMKAKGGAMTVYHVNDEVMEVFKITGFDEILDIR
ncbi:MAG: STAS domain-containing protein [Lachnospiraceae bacterium]|nr:STAS domain-containing protein [Lachnospiraceae bacterium]